MEVENIKVIHINRLLTPAQYDLFCDVSTKYVTCGDAEHTLITKSNFMCFMESAKDAAPPQEREGFTTIMMLVLDRVDEKTFFAFPS